MQKLHLCEACAQKMGVGQGSAFSMSDLLLGQGVGAPLSTANSAKTCQECGWTLRKVKKVGRLGCSGCYQAFEEEIETLLKSIHRATRHRGRRPQHLAQKLLLRDQIEKLEAGIAASIAAEAYEQAAAFRDELRQLKAQEMEGTVHDD
ncbi:excinuclease ABC subunit B [Kiritimatiellaeota bacterium B1221]|nr:excinuclease ABC subunit B [Kiritimatiellaeota bacterium B1221]